MTSVLRSLFLTFRTAAWSGAARECAQVRRVRKSERNAGIIVQQRIHRQAQHQLR
jgi:hypothetical protein